MRPPFSCRCTDGDDISTPTSVQLMAKMRRSLFCPIVASNVQSSRRLSEAVLNGCIPVFIGPPFHTLPLAQVGPRARRVNSMLHPTTYAHAVSICVIYAPVASSGW